MDYIFLAVIVLAIILSTLFISCRIRSIENYDAVKWGLVVKLIAMLDKIEHSDLDSLDNPDKEVK